MPPDPPHRSGEHAGRSTTVEDTRSQNYARLLEHFEPHTTYDKVSPETHRYAAVAEEFLEEQRVGAIIALCETEADAFGVLGDSVLDGYAPDGMYDLNTGDKIDIHVSTPIVTRATDQSITYNPLKDL